MKDKKLETLAREPKLSIVETDLRSSTRGSQRTESRIALVNSATRIETPWLRFGEAQLRWHEGTGKAVVSARLTAGATDFEHDSAYAFQIPVIGLEMNRALGVHGSVVAFEGWVDPEIERFGAGFRVPRGPYDPSTLSDSVTCKECDVPHLIVPEGYFAGPPFDADLHGLVAGKRITIAIGLAPRDAT